MPGLRPAKRRACGPVQAAKLLFVAALAFAALAYARMFRQMERARLRRGAGGLERPAAAAAAAPEAGGAAGAGPPRGPGRGAGGAKHPIFHPCLEDEDALARGIIQIRSAKPKGMSTKEFRGGEERCWRRRNLNEPLLDPRELPSAARLAPQPPPEFRETLFVHRGNLQRLGSGFKDAKGAPLQDLVTERDLADGLLPESGEAAAGPRYGDCAVVSSGGSLAGSNLGARIDAHEVVLRVNQAPTAGHERHVGRKTTIRLVNNLWTATYAKARKFGAGDPTPLERGALLLVTRPNAEDFLRLARKLRKARPDARVRLLSSRIVTAVRNSYVAPYRERLADLAEARASQDVAARVTTALLEGRDTPSSGLVGVFVLLQLCDRVTAYGFSGMNDGSKYHYWKAARQYQNRTHSFTAERALLRRLAFEGKLAFVDGNLENVRTWI